MADLGNLKILLEMSTAGAIGSLNNVEQAVNALNKKTTALELRFNKESYNTLLHQLQDISSTVQTVANTAGAGFAEGMKKSTEVTKGQVASSEELLHITKELDSAENRLADAKARVTQAEETLLRRREKLVDVQRSILQYQEDAELFALRHKTGIESNDIEMLQKYLDTIKELKKLTPWNKGTDSEAWNATTKETVAIVEKLAKKWGIAREEVERYFHSFSLFSGHKYDFSFSDRMGLYNLTLQQRSNAFTPGSKERLDAFKDATRAAKDAVKELTGEEEHLHHALDEAESSLASAKASVQKETAEVQKLTDAKKKLADTQKQTENSAATKGATVQMQQQVTLGADLEGVFKEMLVTLRAIAEQQESVTNARGKRVQKVKEEKEEEKELYDINRLRQIAEEKNGQLTKDQVSVLKQMEAIEKALIDIDQKHSTHLADQLKKWMHYDGVTKEQLGTYQALITRMQAAMRLEEKTTKEAEKANRQRKASAKEREAAAKRQAQLETSILRVETRLLGMDESRLQATTQAMIAKMRTGQVTQEEVSHLSAVLSKEQAILSAEEKKGTAVSKTNLHLGRQSGLLQQINSYLATYLSVFGAVNIIKNLVRITGEFEAQHVALRAILQDVAGADRIFYQLQELAVKSPFTFRNLTDYAKQLSAFSVPMNEIYDTTKRLADVSAGLGVDMSRIILAYGQIRSASFLRGQEVRQLTEAGIPVLQELAKQFKDIEGEAISVGKVFDKISARQVPFEMIEKMFQDLTSEGGKFYQMQETLAETVKGKVSNLQDAWEIMLSKVGENNDAFIKGVLNGVTDLIKNYKELAKAIELAAVAYGTYRVACVAATQAQTMQHLVMAATGEKINAIQALLARLSLTMRKIPGSIMGIVSKLNPWAIGIAAVTTALAALYIHHREVTAHIREADKITSKAIATAEASKSNIHYYIQRLKEAKEGTEEYNKARQAVIDQSGTYISATDAERLSLQSVDDVWVNICKHIEEASKLQAMQSVTADATARKQESQLKVMDRLAQYQNRWKFSNETRMDMAALIRGEITQEELQKRVNEAFPETSIFRKDLPYFASMLKVDFDNAERKFDEEITHTQKSLGDLYGDFEKKENKVEKTLDGWRKRASDYLSTVSGGTRGVKVTEDTNLADFAEGGAKALNELRKALELIPDTESDYKKVEADIKFWENLSEAIYGAGKTEFGNSTKLTKKQLKDAETLRKEQIASIKQSVQDLKEAKKWYDQLTPLLGSDNAKTLLASFNFAVPKEGFNNAFRGYADKLKSLGDKNGAQDVMNWAQGRDINSVLEASKAVEKYTESLRDLEAQTKRLNLTGFAQELDKIIVDADSKNRQLQTNWAQKAKELEKAKDGWIERYRVENEKATAEDAEKAWQSFYDNQVAMAKKSIDTQREYNNKVAQEQINDKASKWVEDMMQKNNINLHDMSDKSLGQMNVLIERMRALVSSDALATIIPNELIEDAKLLNVTFEELLDNIEKIVNTKVGDVQVDRMKKLLGGLSSGLSVLGLSANTSPIQDAYAKYVEKQREQAEALKENTKAQEEYNKARNDFLRNGTDFSGALQKLGESMKKLKEATEATADAQNELKWTAVLAGAQAFGSALSNVGEGIKKIGAAKGDESLEGLGDTLSTVGKGFSDAAGAALAGFAVGGPVGAAIGAGLSVLNTLFDSLVESIVKAEEYNRKMQQASDDWALSVQKIRNEYALLQEQLDTLFGDSSLAKMSGWGNIIREQREFIKSIDTSALGNVKIKTKDYNWWQELWGSRDEYTSLRDIVPELFNDDGSLNFAYLDEFKQSDYWDMLSDDWKHTLEEMAEANEAYEDALAQMRDYLTSVFGEVGESISDALVTAFEESGEAAFDMGDILSSVAKKFVKDWTQAFLVKNYLQKLDDSVEKLWEDNSLSMEEQISQSLGLLRDTLAGMSDKLPEIQAFYEAVEDQFHWADGAGEELGDAIKTALVEQNSSLIAGYINSMRADITMQRNEIMQSISPNVEQISTTLNTHLMAVKSIEGNVARIWSRFDALTTSGSGVKIGARI